MACRNLFQRPALILSRRQYALSAVASGARPSNLDAWMDMLVDNSKKQKSEDAPQSAAAVPSTTTSKRSMCPPDEDPLLHQFARFVMRDGKLHTANGHISDMLEHVRSLTAKEPLPVVRQAIGEAAPLLRIVNQRLTATKRVVLPLALDEKHRVRQALVWIVDASSKRKGEKIFGRRLALEVLAVIDGSSKACEKRDEVHRQATTARSNVGKITVAKGKQVKSAVSPGTGR